MYDLHDEGQEENTTYLFPDNNVEGSIQLHDYCGSPVKSTVCDVNRCEQTDNVLPYMSNDESEFVNARLFSEISTQTCAKTCLSKLIQTEPSAPDSLTLQYQVQA
ncbi:hypothetical protein DPMN_126594 [Dreissena polymorpha]|uniref:Uncharacterized protein n=1 Tax=Dreissena polymorpha TaxID=45954 RepID=A0A9D4H0C0_DREPO|nr:hypothetical protein DPMN_126594 [Dreissena polymorpha]